MPKKCKFTKQQIKSALEESGGLKSIAANILNCAPNTIANYIKKWPELEEIREAAVNDLLDLAENVILNGIKAENLTATIFYLKTKGKNRGYSERQEVTGKDGEAINVISPRERLKSRIDSIIAKEETE